MQNRVGHVTVGAALALSGLWLLLTNLGLFATAPPLAQLWPLLPIGLGLEYLVASRGGRRVSFGGSGIVLLIVTLILFAGGGVHLSFSGPQGRLNLVQELPVSDIEELRVSTGTGRLELYRRAEPTLLVEGQVSNATGFQSRQVGSVLTLAPGASQVHRLVLGVPEGLAVTIEGSTGSVRIGALTGAVNVTTSTGSVDLNGVSGPISVQTRTGALRAHLAAGYADTASLSSSTGRIEVWLNGASARVRAETKTGSLSGPRWLQVNRQGAGADGNGTSGAGLGLLTLESTTGAIKIYD